jgi:hypothetical protein
MQNFLHVFQELKNARLYRTVIINPQHLKVAERVK